MNGSTIVIHKSLFGLLAIFVVGAILVAGLLIGLASTIHQDNLNLSDLMPRLLLVGVLVVVIGTFLQSYLYGLNKIVLTSDTLLIVTWSSLFTSKSDVCEYRHIQDLDAKRPGIFSQIVGFGTLFIETAGTAPNFRITLVPRVDYWRNYIAQQADTAATPVKEAP